MILGWITTKKFRSLDASLVMRTPGAHDH